MLNQNPMLRVCFLHAQKEERFGGCLTQYCVLLKGRQALDVRKSMQDKMGGVLGCGYRPFDIRCQVRARGAGGGGARARAAVEATLGPMGACAASHMGAHAARHTSHLAFAGCAGWGRGQGLNARTRAGARLGGAMRWGKCVVLQDCGLRAVALGVRGVGLSG